MTFEHPAPERLPLLRQLWKTAFGDTDEFLDAFFRTGFSPERSRCAVENDSLAGMLYWFDVRCGGQKMAYIYAVATHPGHRGKGVCRGLMTDTQALLQHQGYAGVLLVPQSEGLRKMYASFGYSDCTSVSETFCAAGAAPVPVHSIDREEYARLRRHWLPEGGVVQEGENLTFLETQAAFYSGTDFLLAAQSTPEGALFGTELLGNGGEAPGILRALGYSQGTFRTPGEKVPFAMFLPLIQDAQQPSYFGLAFD